jgi:uncharacterized protein (DUF983 family)
MNETPQAAAKKPSAADDSAEERYDTHGLHPTFVNAIRGTILLSGEIMRDWGLNQSTPLALHQPISLSHRLILSIALAQDLIGVLHKLLYAHAQSIRPAGRVQLEQPPAPAADSPAPPDSNAKAN